MIISLSRAERERFAQWLLQDAESSEEIAQQMKILGGVGGKIVAPHLETEATAFRLVAKKLLDMEEQMLRK